MWMDGAGGMPRRLLQLQPPCIAPTRRDPCPIHPLGTKQGVPELTASLRAYEREVEKLQARVRKEELEAEAAEALADEASGGGGGGSGGGGGLDPVEVSRSGGIFPEKDT